MGQVKKLYMDWLEDTFPRSDELTRHDSHGHEDDDGQEQEDLRMKQEMENWSMDFDSFISRMIHGCTTARAEGELGDASADVKGKEQEGK